MPFANEIKRKCLLMQWDTYSRLINLDPIAAALLPVAAIRRFVKPAPGLTSTASVVPGGTITRRLAK